MKHGAKVTLICQTAKIGVGCLQIKLAVWEKQNHKCAICGKEFDYQLMEGDHISPWRDGGRTEVKNCQMLCRECNRRKGSK